MLLEDFKSGVWIQRDHYKSFEPALINQTWVWQNSRINVLLERATKSLSSFDSMIKNTSKEEIDRYIHLHVFKEAEASSRIEGTETSIEEVLKPKESLPLEKRDDWQEVQNYVEALREAVLNKSLPLSNRLIRKAHKTLMAGARGDHKQPGDFRQSQNWIGGNNLRDAAFIPPHHLGVEDYMSDLEKFLHNDNIEVPHLIKIAIAHYQFETIHPFLDGNGRIGRLIIPLYLIEKEFLNQPAFYISDFFERHRNDYYDSLMRGKDAK